MKTRIFTVIIGDLLKSRSIVGRDEFRKKLSSALELVNQELGSEIYAPLMLTRGVDELSGVLSRPNTSYRICKALNDKIYPMRFRFAIVRDTLDVAIDSHNAGSMDGVAYHTASGLIAQLRKQKRIYCFEISPDDIMNSVLNDLTNLIEIIQSDWTFHQRRIIDLYMQSENQRVVASSLNISQQSVSTSLKKTHWKEIKRAENSVDAILARYNRNKLY